MRRPLRGVSLGREPKRDALDQDGGGEVNRPLAGRRRRGPGGGRVLVESVPCPFGENRRLERARALLRHGLGERLAVAADHVAEEVGVGDRRPGERHAPAVHRRGQVGDRRRRRVGDQDDLVRGNAAVAGIVLPSCRQEVPVRDQRNGVHTERSAGSRPFRDPRALAEDLHRRPGPGTVAVHRGGRSGDDGPAGLLEAHRVDDGLGGSARARSRSRPRPPRSPRTRRVWGARPGSTCRGSVRPSAIRCPSRYSR